MEVKTKVKMVEIKKTEVKKTKEIGTPPKGTGHPPVEAPSKVEQQMEQMLNMMGGIVQRIEAIENKEILVNKEPAGKSPDSNGLAEPSYSKESDPTYPSSYIPAKWRQLVDEILTPEFGLTVNDFEDRTDFQINIIVPEQFSSISKEEKASGVKDIRSKVITRAMGENGVREWAQKVRFNLNKYFMKEGKASPFR